MWLGGGERSEPEASHIRISLEMAGRSRSPVKDNNNFNKETKMAHQQQRNVFEKVMELLIDHGFDSMADVLKILFNEAMKIEREDVLAARSYQRTSDRKGYANGYKPKTVDTRMDE